MEEIKCYLIKKFILSLITKISDTNYNTRHYYYYCYYYSENGSIAEEKCNNI